MKLLLTTSQEIEWMKLLLTTSQEDTIEWMKLLLREHALAVQQDDLYELVD